MKSDRLARHLLAAFLLALGLYIFSYWFIESRRVADGPWRVTFQTNASGQTELIVRQDSLGLGPVHIRIEIASPNPPSTPHELVFDTARPVPFEVPGGQCLFQDPTFLPGTVALEISGIQLQMLPRVLTIGTNEFPWKPDVTIVVDAAGVPRLSE